MITVYVAEQRNGGIKIATDRDCLPADAIRTATCVFDSEDSIMASAEMYWHRGFNVSVDLGTTNYEYETESVPCACGPIHSALSRNAC